MKKILKKIDIVHDWFDEVIGGEYEVTNQQAYDLIENLEKTNIGKKMEKTRDEATWALLLER